jgi:carbamoyl-phosphate synthase large subunit
LINSLKLWRLINMPLNENIKKVLLIGSGPIVIGQAAEFDYSGTQALRVLKEAGIETVLVNSNPATIMTDKAMADKIYIEPLTLKTIERIIEKEKPDSILSGFGGQTGLTLSMQLAKDGFLKKNGVVLLGSSPETIDKSEDRLIFKNTMESIGQPVIPSQVVTDIDNAVSSAESIGYPIIIRPAFTLGGTGGGIVNNEAELREIADKGLKLSPIHQILVEKSIAGWKEIEFEVIRDKAGNSIAVCSMENFDPVGIHTGDSIVIAPTVTLADKEYQMLRSAALNIIDELKVEGGCNCQFALHPQSYEYAVIEVNPRVSRSSALASKATGYPIAKVSAKIAIGYTLDEIMNQITGKTYAAFEPTLDYVAVKFPKWPFDKFVYAKRDLGTQMKATGEVMSIADTFEAALMKAVRGAEIGLKSLHLAKCADASDSELKEHLEKTTDERLFYIYEALQRKITVDEIYDITKIDRWFLYKLVKLVCFEKKLKGNNLTEELYIEGKRLGYLDETIRNISGKEIKYIMKPSYKMVDTCGGEFRAETPYFYSSFDTEEMGTENEALEFIKHSSKQKIIVLGSGPIRIGQGIEFDYASVQCVWTLKSMGYEVIVINNNPETVSTDFDIGDRLYFEPLNEEDVLNIIKLEKPIGVFVAFGGQTSIKLTKALDKTGIQIIGTLADSIDMAEDRERFDALLERIGVMRPKGYTVMNMPEALEAAHKLSYPVLIRPSYVLGGQNMIIAFNDEDIIEYMKIVLDTNPDNSVLIDKYISGKEIEVDAICDGDDILIPGIMEHIERTGIHSGDSIAVYPAPHIDDNTADKITVLTRKICFALKAKGLINIQYIITNDQIYIIEVNPRASRTIPYLSKVTNVPMCELATKTSLGMKLTDLGYGIGLYKASPFTAVKVPVFSFEKLPDLDTQLGPEMKSTGEVLGIGKNLQEGLYKGLLAAGYKMCKKGGVFISVRNSDKAEVAPIAKKFAAMEFLLYATEGNAKILKNAGLNVTVVDKIHEGSNNAMGLIESGKINYIISTSAKGRNPVRDSVKLRIKASQLGIPCLTAIDTANALVDSLTSYYNELNIELIDINNLREAKKKLQFVKMQGCGDDYIYFDCYYHKLSSPETLSVILSDRYFGIGGAGIVLIEKSKIADAKMRMFNLDGSEGRMGGNAIRCVGKYLYDKGFVYKKSMTIETLSGVRKLNLITQHGLVYRVEVDMDKVILSPELIPVNIKVEQVIDYPISIDKVNYRINCISIGNPHCVVFCKDVDGLDTKKIGPKFENNSLFPERVNTEFVKIIDENTIRIRVWERGSGETVSCGTGACAATVAAVLNGYCKRNQEVRVLLNGGELIVRYTDDEHVFMEGNCEKIYEGVVEI